MRLEAKERSNSERIRRNAAICGSTSSRAANATRRLLTRDALFATFPVTDPLEKTLRFENGVPHFEGEKLDRSPTPDFLVRERRMVLIRYLFVNMGGG
jgi:hypothetical protein